MLSAEENKPVGKPGQRRGKKKAGQRAKGGVPQSVVADQLQDARPETGEEIPQDAAEDINAPVASIEGSPREATAVDASTHAPIAPADIAPVSLKSVADAYGDYTRKSIEQVWSFYGKLAAARSPAEAFELQMAFAKQAYETFVAESEKIGDLQGELARQRAMSLEGFVARFTLTTFELNATRH